jgi:hypothetical protein
VNFFGHAAFAFYERADDAFVLGAMLPDFATMIRARPPLAAHEQLTDGIAHHHATDEVFHGSRVFRRLCQDAFATLEARGVRRGTARAVAHIGIELLLDGVLARDPGACAAYTRALAEAPEARLGRHLRWQEDEQRERFTVLCSALARRGLQAPDSRLDAMVWRLSRALAGRARLEMRAEDEAAVRLWAAGAEPVVQAEAPELLHEVRSGLSERRNSPVASGIG